MGDKGSAHTPWASGQLLPRALQVQDALAILFDWQQCLGVGHETNVKGGNLQSQTGQYQMRQQEISQCKIL